jgi:hypothetical protein
MGKIEKVLISFLSLIAVLCCLQICILIYYTYYRGDDDCITMHINTHASAPDYCTGIYLR